MTDTAYRRKQPADWWRSHPWFRLYMLRELTSIPVGLYMLNLIRGLVKLGNGADAWQGWLSAQSNFLMVMLGLLALAAVCFHMVTWFSIAPKAMPNQIGESKIPHKTTTLAHYAATAVISIYVLAVIWSV